MNIRINWSSIGLTTVEMWLNDKMRHNLLSVLVQRELANFDMWIMSSKKHRSKSNKGFEFTYSIRMQIERFICELGQLAHLVVPLQNIRWFIKFRSHFEIYQNETVWIFKRCPLTWQIKPIGIQSRENVWIVFFRR